MQTMQSTSSKVCFKCGVEKPLTDFYKHVGMADGHLNKCKECAKQDNNKYREKNIESVREYDRSRQHIDRHKNPREYRRKNPQKYKAHNAVNNAVRDGRLLKSEVCEECGEDRHLYGHHHSYEKVYWLDVKWLCGKCHAKEHKRLKGLGIDPDV